MLTHKQSRFGFEYCKDYNGTKAAIRAGYAENSAQETASRLLSNPMVQKRIAEREEELACVHELSVEWVLKQYLDIARADPRELTEMIIQPCAECWPAALDLQEPNPLCSLCLGRGLTIVRLKDTRKLSGPAARLFAGVKETKNGIEIKMRDQDGALQFLSKFLGMVVERNELSGPGGGPVPLATANVSELTDEQLLALCAGEKVIDGGIIGGTLRLSDGNESRMSEL